MKSKVKKHENESETAISVILYFTCLNLPVQEPVPSKFQFAFWSQFEIGACTLYTNNRSEIIKRLKWFCKEAAFWYVLYFHVTPGIFQVSPDDGTMYGGCARAWDFPCTVGICTMVKIGWARYTVHPPDTNAQCTAVSRVVLKPLQHQTFEPSQSFSNK